MSGSVRHVGKTLRTWAPWALAAMLALALVGVGLPGDGRAGEGSNFWRERSGEAQPVLPRGYSPLPSLSGLVRELKPAVVNIYTTQVIKPRVMSRRRGPARRDPSFEEFFGGGDPFGFFEAPGRELRRNSLGSGFLVSPEGHVLTNHHVVDSATEIKVRLADEKTYDAKVIGSDEKTEVALLKIEADRPLPYVYLGDSDRLEVGDWVIAIGNPFGLGHTVTAGIISGKDRQIGQGPYDDFLQTDASINPGNSGGPLFDSAGNVVGINTAIIAGGSGIGFAVPINLAKSLLPQLHASGKVTRGWLGIGIQDLSEELAESFGVDAKSGALVSQVFAGSPAAKAGLKAGDVVLRVDGVPVGSSRALTHRIAAVPPGQKVKLDLLRDGKPLSASVVLGEREQGEAQAAVGGGSEGGVKESALGLSLAPLTARQARRLGLEESLRGLLVEEVDPAGPTAGLIQPNDVLLEVNRQQVTSTAELQRALARGQGDKRVLLRIQRGPSQLFLVIGK